MNYQWGSGEVGDLAEIYLSPSISIASCIVRAIFINKSYPYRKTIMFIYGKGKWGIGEVGEICLSPSIPIAASKLELSVGNSLILTP
jgi:hypothetical protein